MLTIEELKALKVGDWIWDDTTKDYLYIKDKTDELLLCLICGQLTRRYYNTHGTKWLAYKNKEEADGKSIALPYLLCTSNKFACVIWRDKDGKVKKTYTMPIDEAKGVLKEKESLE